MYRIERRPRPAAPLRSLRPCVGSQREVPFGISDSSLTLLDAEALRELLAAGVRARTRIARGILYNKKSTTHSCSARPRTCNDSCVYSSPGGWVGQERNKRRTTLAAAPTTAGAACNETSKSKTRQKDSSTNLTTKEGEMDKRDAMYRIERRRGASHFGTALCGSQREVLFGSVASSLSSRGDDGETIAGRFLFFYPILPSYT